MMPEKCTVFLASSIREQLEARPQDCSAHRGLWLALDFAHNIGRIGMLCIYRGDLGLPGDNPEHPDFYRVKEYNCVEFFSAGYSKKDALLEALKHAMRIECHIFGSVPDPIHVNITCHNDQREGSYWAIHVCFDRKGGGGVMSQGGFFS